MKEQKLENKADDELDWVLLTSVLKAERASMTEVVGEALGVYGNQLFAEIETMVEQMIDAKMAHLTSMITTQVALMMQECARHKADVDTKMTALRKDLGVDTQSVVLLPNPLGERKAKVA
jgi:hypothetical protein